MALKSFSPVTPSRRNMTAADYSVLTVNNPEKSLTKGLKASGGRNNNGRITTRFRGGANKRNYRLVDFKRAKEGVPATVKTIEYDPYRSAYIALIFYKDGEKAYILAANGMKVGDVVMNGAKAELKPGNSMKLKDIPVGINLHNIELIAGSGAKLVRSAGQYAVLRGKDEKYAQVKLPSGEVRMINLECRDSIGEVGNSEFMNIKIGNAGKKRYTGKRPHVRGVVMNPVDHPMGGGEGRTSGGGHPVSPWGQLAKGYRTRSPKKNSSKFIVERRKK